TRDDLLTSLTKDGPPPHAEEAAPEAEEAGQFQGPNATAVEARPRDRGSARGALVIFLGGLAAVWLYGYVTGAYDIPSLRGVTESPAVQVGVQLASSNQILFGAVSISVLLGAFYLLHRKKN